MAEPASLVPENFVHLEKRKGHTAVVLETPRCDLVLFKGGPKEAEKFYRHARRGVRGIIRAVRYERRP
ncbi:MAG: hypothetical protein ABI629_08785 [bacterium]